jgi:hypothetical protein
MPYDNVPNWGGPYVTQPGTDDSSAPWTDNRAISPGLFATVGARLLEGRDFAEGDDTAAAPIVIVDDQLARRAWPGQRATGRRIAVDPFASGHARYTATIVGVVRHIRHRSLLENLDDQVYYPERQIQRNPLAFVVRSDGDPAALARAARRVVQDVDPLLPIYDLRPLSEYVSGATAAQRFTSALAVGFAVVAMLLASVGVYGVIAYATASRRSEFGLRLALGARPRQVIALVLREGAVLAVFGVGAGIAGGAVCESALRAQLYGVPPGDATSFAVAILAIGIVVIGACWLPARRAAMTSPVVAMRAE